MMRNSLWTVLIVAVSFLTILSTGCGKKADPRYLHVNYPEAVSDLDVSIDKDGAVLKWSIPGRAWTCGTCQDPEECVESEWR